MNDNELIRRKDALKIAREFCVEGYEGEIEEAFDALPAVDARAAALRESVKALRDWQDALIANGLHETALTVGMAADAVLALIVQAKP